MKIIATRTTLAIVLSLSLAGVVTGCSHLEKAPQGRMKFMYIHKPLPEAARMIDQARAAGKDKQCPAEFKAASDTVDKAYEVYNSCRTQEGIALAQDAISKINALCPKVAVVPAPKPAPAPTPAPAPPPAPRPKVMVFDEAALFDFDKSDLKPAGKELIKAYREEAKAEMSRADKVRVSGHTDNVGAADYNKALSLRRAEAVRDYLISIGVEPGRLEVIGEGETRPIADNTTKEGRAKNRRVEIEVIGLGK